MSKAVGTFLCVIFVLTHAPAAVAGLVPKRTVLDNGVILLTSEQRALPMVSIELLIDAGARYDSAGLEGLANLTARLLTYGTKRRTASQISDSLDFIGASLSAGAAEDLANVNMTILKKDLATGLNLLFELLNESTFPQAEINRQKQAVLAALRAREEDPGDIAERKFVASLFPKSPYGRPVEGTASSVNAISQDEILKFYERYFRPNRTIMVVVGDGATRRCTCHR